MFKVATLANDHLITARKMLEDAGAEGKGDVFAGFLTAVGGDNILFIYSLVMAGTLMWV